MKAIAIEAFSDCISLTDVYYDGTDKQWSAIEIGMENDMLNKARIHYRSSDALSDLDGDEEVNASDAALVLIAAAEEGVSGVLPLTAAQKNAADVNRDGNVNASDAAIILIYAAKVGTGYTGSMREFMMGGMR